MFVTILDKNMQNQFKYFYYYFIIIIILIDINSNYFMSTPNIPASPQFSLETS
jgi:hypothetical protein